MTVDAEIAALRRIGDRRRQPVRARASIIIDHRAADRSLIPRACPECGGEVMVVEQRGQLAVPPIAELEAFGVGGWIEAETIWLRWWCGPSLGAHDVGCPPLVA